MGSLSRYGVSQLMLRLCGDKFPYGTLIVNVVGCLLLGLLMELALNSRVLPDNWRVPITVGFLGAFTTFSTFGYETMRFVTSGHYGPALMNIGLNLGVGLLATWTGLVLARLLLARLTTL